ncbi:MAG TPA: hemolysin III family protein [Blastocatellia bacterium]|nr:hemolysin III family protein [Blastocatellia bacterium]
MSESDDNTFIEEMANSITHGLGLALSVAGFVVLLVLSIMRGSAWHIVGCSIFGLTLVLAYLASTLYHSLHRSSFRRVLQILDHSAIYLLIAGTYTPFTLINLRGVWGWTLFALVWTLSLAGIAFKFMHGDRFKIISTIGYVALGWIAVIAIKPLFAAVPLAGITWLFAGGLCYTVGVIFFAWKRLPFSHAVWHLFVVAGSVCHYCAVLFYVLPVRV